MRTRTAQANILERNGIILISNPKTGNCIKTIPGQITARKENLNNCIKELYKGNKSKIQPTLLRSWIDSHIKTIQELHKLKTYFL